MKEEPNKELQQLLDTIEEHGRNTRRQAQLSDLIDRLDTEEKTIGMPQKRGKLIPLWWAMGVAAACLLLWLIIKPSGTQPQEENKPIFVEQNLPNDSAAIEVEEQLPQQAPIKVQESVTEVVPVEMKKPKTKTEKPIEKIQPSVSEEPFLVAMENVEKVDSVQVMPTEITTAVPQEPLALETSTSKRRVIRSEHLVGYEKQGKPQTEAHPKRGLENKTIFGQPQDPNMKNGMLAMEIKF